MNTRVSTLIAVVVPFAGLVAALWYGCTLLDFALFAVMSTVTGLGITIGYHRYFTHRSFETRPLIQAILGAAGSMAIQGPITFWVSAHRNHHKHADECGEGLTG